jgi:hypothetical protein
MAYSDFTLKDLKKKFNVNLIETAGVFQDTSPQKPSSILESIMQDNIPLALAVNTEKARSELLISPILVELRNQMNKEISLFSGVDFTVDPSLGLNGVVDFLISLSPEQLVIESPITVLVEAKKENLNAAIPQCIAEMIAAQKFNEIQENVIPIINGVVTTGSAWKFLRLEETTVTLDLSEYYIPPVDKVLGILNYLLS